MIVDQVLDNEEALFLPRVASCVPDFRRPRILKLCGSKVGKDGGVRMGELVGESRRASIVQLFNASQSSSQLFPNASQLLSPSVQLMPSGAQSKERGESKESNEPSVVEHIGYQGRMAAKQARQAWQPYVGKKRA